MTIIGKDRPIQIRSTGDAAGTSIRVRGADGEWHPLPSVMSATITIEAGDLVRVALTMVNVEVEVESETVTVTPHKICDTEATVRNRRPPSAAKES